MASDHHLLVARLKLKLRRNWIGKTNQRFGYNTFLLNDTNKREEFSITLSNKFQALQELMEEETIDERWQKVKGAVTSTCNEVLGPRTPKHKGWISTETLKKIEERKAKKVAVNNSRTRTAKAKALEEYKGMNRNVKRSLKADKRNYLESLAVEAEEAAYHGNMRDLYATIRNLSGKYSKPERPVKDKDGHPISDLEGQKKRWVEHLEELLNRPAPPDPPDVQPADSDLTIDYNPPTKEEIQNAIKQLRNGKAAGPDNIPAEAMKADIRTNVELP